MSEDVKLICTSPGEESSRGKIYHLLANPIYIGKIRHQGQLYDGEHQAIVDAETFERVQQLLADQAAHPKGGAVHTNQPGACTEASRSRAADRSRRHIVATARDGSESDRHTGECSSGLAALADGSERGIAAVAKSLDMDGSDLSRILPLAFLSPKITEAILYGRQPRDLTLRNLTRGIELPIDWTQQNELLAR